jgi:hypothetical protein
MRRWVNPSQPDLLQIATFIGYFRAVFVLLFGLDFQFIAFPLSDVSARAVGSGATISNPLLRIGLPVLLAGGGYLLSQGRRLGWQLLLAGAALPLLARLLLAFGIYLGEVDLGSGFSPLSYDEIGLLFEVALVGLLVHPRSREYQKIWLE